jgi:hypothetical protein
MFSTRALIVGKNYKLRILNVHPESYENVKNNRRSHRQQGYINEIFTDSGRSYSNFITQVGTNSEHLPFDKVFESIHSR